MGYGTPASATRNEIILAIWFGHVFGLADDQHRTGAATAGVAGVRLGTNSSLRKVDLRGIEMQRAVLKKQDLREMKRILAAGFKIDDPIGCGTFNSVDGAVAVGNLEILKFLLAKGAQPKGSALMQAVSKKPEVSFRLVEALLKAGADPHYKERYPENYFTGDTHQPDTNRFSSPLHVACYRGNYEVAELLLKHPGDELNALDIDGRTPLMWATEQGHEKVVKLLLGKGANVRVRNGRVRWR